jgi:hypothetical protein
MYYPIGPGSLYRVTATNTAWPNPVKGHGAYYLPKQGNRYNRTQQLTVSCSEDPWVAITEGAYYQAMKWQNDIASSRINAVSYPLRSEHLFWAFRINPLPNVIDLENPLAVATFSYSPHVLTNPGRNYTGTQEIADDVRTYTPPLGSANPRPEGVKAPSVRTPRVGTFQPFQLALFVLEVPNIVPYDQRSVLVAKMCLEYEFLAAHDRSQVTFTTGAIDWVRPRFRISAIHNEPSVSPIPALDGRPGSKPIRLNRWLTLSICY